jgi:hypothetical protein
MSGPDDIAARRVRHLKALAEHGLEKASRLQEQMIAAKPSEVAALAAEFEQVSRAIRKAITAAAELERRRRRAERLAQERVRSLRALIPDPESRTIH